MPKPIDTNEIRADELHFHPKSRETILALCDEIDRLRATKQPPQGKTVRVKVAVSVTGDGEWIACGGSNIQKSEVLSYCEHEPEVGDVLHWLTADLPIPEETVVEAEVE